MEDYLVTYEALTPVHGKSQTVAHARSPYILENLGQILIHLLALLGLVQSNYNFATMELCSCFLNLL